MEVEPNDTRCAGISWHAGRAALVLAADAGGAPQRLPLELGAQFGVRVVGTRRCVGARFSADRGCPFRSPIAAAALDAQCGACAAADPGRALARDAVRDPRPFRLYLAWFGPDLLKVGICASERGHDRLDEQGALAYTWLARGEHQLIRLAEQAVAASGLATERCRRHRKLTAWPPTTSVAERAAHLLTAHQRLGEQIRWPDGVVPEPFAPADNVALFGLDQLKQDIADVAAINEHSVLSGRTAAIAGNELVLALPRGPATISGRRLAGWPLRSTNDPAAGYTTHKLTAATDLTQHRLF